MSSECSPHHADAPSYEFYLTLLSLVSCNWGHHRFGFFMIGTRQVNGACSSYSALSSWARIVAMHDTCMAARRLPADLRYDRVLVALGLFPYRVGASTPRPYGLAFSTTG